VAAVPADLASQLQALVAVAARLARAESRGDAVRIALLEGVPAIGGRAGAFHDEGESGVPRRAEGARVSTVPVRTKDGTSGTLSAELPSSGEEASLRLLESLADLLAAALERESRVASLFRELAHAGEMQQFLAQSSESLALSLDDRATLSVLAHLAVPRLADWCIVDVATRDGAVARSAVTCAKGEDAELAARLEAAPPPHGAVGPDSRELLASELDSVEGLPADLVPAARAIAARSAVIVYALGASEGAARIALFTARSRRQLGFDDFSLAEELARRASHALERAALYGEAQRANDAKDVFLATVSHELRGPLAAISMWTHALGLKSCDEPTRVRALQAIDESVRMQGRLIEDMIDLSRLVAGKLRLELAPVSIGEVVRGAVDCAAPAASAKRVGLAFVGDAEATIEGDEQRLEQVFGSVIANAIEYTPAEGKVEVSVSLLPTGVRVVVRDDGEGISESFLPEVFEPFRQEDASLTRARGGLGLGLAVARKIVLLHGGTIRAESGGRGEGATFSIELPRAPDSR
jgi:signal transduction histidine kinase